MNIRKLTVPKETACPLCGAPKVELWHNRVWEMEEGQVCRCSNCDVAFLVPMLDDATEAALYKDYNRHARARGVTESLDSKELYARCLPQARHRLRLVSKYFCPDQRVLEIGAAAGSFLSLLPVKERYVVEPDDANREFCQKFAEDVYSSIEDVPAETRFDVICMFHVLEHMRDPVAFLQKCGRHLSREGTLLVEVPHSEDPLISLYDCKPFMDFYFQPMHPYIYSLKSLDYVFAQAGFRRREIFYDQRYGLDNHLKWLCRDKEPGRTFGLFQDNEAYKETLIRNKKTDTLFYAAQINSGD